MVKGNRNILGLILTPSIRSVKILVNKRGVKQVGINSSTKRYNWWVSMQLNIPQLDGGSANVLVRVQREPVENYPERLSITQYVSGRKS